MCASIASARVEREQQLAEEAALRLIIQTRKRVERAEKDAHRALLAAIKAGVPQTRVAQAAHISRMSMWRILNTDKSAGAAATARRTTTKGRNPDAAASA